MLKEACVQQVAGQVSNRQSICRAPSRNVCSQLRLPFTMQQYAHKQCKNRTTLLQGIASLASFLETFGYEDAGDELAFPKKKLRARWMRKPDMPRVFISEIKASYNSLLLWKRVDRSCAPVLKGRPCSEG